MSISILRVYTPDGECYREPRDIIRILTESTEPVELDWADSRGHVKMATSADLAGQTVLIEEVPFQIPNP
jgi:hypothetical protein